MATEDVVGIKVLKNGGLVAPFLDSKIKIAINKAAHRAQVALSEDQQDRVVQHVKDKLIGVEEVTVSKLHDLVQDALSEVSERVYLSYKAYRDYKNRFSKSFEEAAISSSKIIYEGDKENANKDSSLNSTKQALIAETYMKELMDNFELDKEWIDAHNRGDIHIHDKGSRYLNQTNCCLFDMGNVLKGGFEVNGVKETEPTNVISAWALLGDTVLNASSQQYGGFSIPAVDTIMARYAEKSYNRHLEFLKEVTDEATAEAKSLELTRNDIRQGYQGVEHKLNTVSNALGQVPFVTFSFAMDQSHWAREVTKAILDVRTEGIGKEKITAVFPKLVFTYRSDIHGQGMPNRDLFLQAVECSKTRLYPDFLSFDNPQDNLLAQIYEETGEILVGMGCRSFLSRATNPHTGKEVYTGRSNVGVVSLNIPKYAMEAVNLLDDFDDVMGYIDERIESFVEMAKDIHLMSYEKIGKMTGSTNPLLYVQGGSWMSVDYDEPVAPILELATASVGFIGLEEAVGAIRTKFEVKDEDIESIKHRIIDKLNEEVDRHREETGKLISLYASPAESLIYRFQNINKKEFGVIKGFTDRDYMTNSFHVHVSREVNVLDKIDLEAPFHSKSAGGRISVVEYPYAVDSNVLTDTIEYAMARGLYYGINVVSSSCGDCLNKGDFDVCDVCGSHNVTTVIRVCGYLSYSQTKGDTRLNKGKLAESKERVKHTYI